MRQVHEDKPIFLDAFDTKLMKTTLLNIINGKTVQIPEYDFKTHSR